MILHALQRCKTRRLGVTLCGLRGTRHHETSSRRVVYEHQSFRVPAPGKAATCQRCLTIQQSREKP